MQKERIEHFEFATAPMSNRTVTRDREIVAEGRGGSLMIFPSSNNIERTPDNSFLAKFTIKRDQGIMCRTGLHWHETHTEYLRVSSGKAFVTVNDKTSIIDANSGEICIPPGVVHEWGLADEMTNEELIIWERTEPADGEKEIFFRNLISSFIDSSIGNPFSLANITRRLSNRDVLQMFVTFRGLDNYPVFWNRIGRRYVTYLALTIANFIGKIFYGLQPFYVEYTPQHLWNRYKEKRH